METIGDLAHEGVGYLDMRDYKRAQWAYEQSHPAGPFMLWLRDAGHVSFTVDDVKVSGSTDLGIPIPATKLAWEEITRISTELNQWPGVEEAAADKFGASLLLDLGREVGTAWARWPMEDKPHRMNAMRCGNCEQLTLMYRPPRFPGDLRIVNCDCGYVLDEDEFALAVEMIGREERERKKRA